MNAPHPDTGTTVVYKRAGDDALTLQIFRPQSPADGPVPCAMFLHGGGWRNGDPSRLAPLAATMAQHGFLGISVQYRLLRPQQRIPREGLADVRSAVRWVRAHAAELGCDPHRIAAGGISAGGHLAAMAAMNAPFDDPADDLSVSARPDALILMSTPLDFDGYDAKTPIEERRPYAPLHLMDANLPPTLLLAGTKDETVPIEQAVAFRDKALSLGVREVRLVSFEGRGHALPHKLPPADKQMTTQARRKAERDHEVFVGELMAFFQRVGWR